MITRASDSPNARVEFLKTGLSKLDTALGGGVPFKKITEISGPWSVGKSTLAMSLVARAQSEGRATLWADSEFSLEYSYASALGVQLDKLDLIQERYGETMLDDIETWAAEHKDGLIVIDSIGGLLSKQEAEKSAEERTIGAQAKMVATFARKMVPILSMNNHALIVLNHEFTDIMSGKIKTAGGAKLEYHKSVWIRLKKSFNKQVSEVKQDGDGNKIRVGDVIEAEVRKNKVAPTVGHKAELLLIYGKGFSSENDLLEEALAAGIITKQGNTYYAFGEKLGIGLGKARTALGDEALAAKVKEALKR